MDAPGLLLRDQLANRFGRHLCRTVAWPEGCKDACDVLREYGPDAVTAAIRQAQPYPVEGLQNVLPGTLLRLREAPPPETLTTGCQATDDAFRLPTEGRLIVVTGKPNHGKTVWTRYVLLHIARYHNRRLAIFSPEMQPWQHFALECAEVLMGKTFWPKGDGGEAMTRDEIARAEAWLLPRLTIIASDAESDPPTLDYLLEKARMAVLRDGVRDLLIDPWNEVTPDRGALTETEWIGRCLQRLKAFGLMHECNVWVIAHPKNPPQFRPHEKPTAPGLYDINGGANWANKADLGLTVHCPDGPGGVTEIHVSKVRFRRHGQRGRIARIQFDPLTGRYSDPTGPAQDAAGADE
jgi:twinkle protein